MSVAEIYEMFPNLKERANSPGTRLSGGEQQMLAVARILRTGARLLLLDEISEGLAPVIVQKLAEMIRTLKAKGYTIVLVEQNFRFAAPLADRFYVMEHGQYRQAVRPARTQRQHGHAAGIPRRLAYALSTNRFHPQETTSMKLKTLVAALAVGLGTVQRIRADQTPARSRSASSPTCPACMPTSTARPAAK